MLKKDAERIIAALSQHTGLSFPFDHVDITVWEEFLMLWLVRAYELASGEETEDKYHFVYAQNQQHAATLAHEWFKQYPHLPHHSFTVGPEGFIIGNIAMLGRQQRETDH
jgi:hypothetical protein